MKTLKLWSTSIIVGAFSLGLAGTAQAVVQECYDVSDFCNDIKIVYTDGNEGGGMTHVFGREYGCGYLDRGFTGVIKKTSTAKHIVVTGGWNDSTQLGTIHLNLNDPKKTSGTGSYAYVSTNGGSNIYGTATYTKVSCPASSNMAPADEEPATPGRDASVRK
jgi:hypothetical protein